MNWKSFQCMLPWGAVLLLASCSLSPQNYLDEPIAGPPKQLASVFTETLGCFGDLTRAYQRPVVYLTSSKVEDATGVARSSGGEIPADATPMMQSSIVRIGGNINYIANYPVLSANLLKIYGMPIPKINKEAPRPTLYLDATISAYDRAVLKNNKGGGLDGEDGGFAVNKNSTSSVITVDINLVKIPSMEMVPKVQSVNSVELRDTKVDGDVDVSIFGVGLDLSLGAKGLSARHQAVRALLDVGVVQTIGRYLTLPWWKCSPVHTERDPLVVESLRNYYRTLSVQDRIRLFQKSLLKRGYEFEEVEGEINVSLVQAIHRFQKENNHPYTDQLTEDVYVDIALSIPDNLPKTAPPIPFTQSSEAPQTN